MFSAFSSYIFGNDPQEQSDQPSNNLSASSQTSPLQPRNILAHTDDGSGQPSASPPTDAWILVDPYSNSEMFNKEVAVESPQKPPSPSLPKWQDACTQVSTILLPNTVAATTSTTTTLCSDVAVSCCFDAPPKAFAVDAAVDRTPPGTPSSDGSWVRPSAPTSALPRPSYASVAAAAARREERKRGAIPSSPIENLLIAHPSASVYAGVDRRHLTNPPRQRRTSEAAMDVSVPDIGQLFDEQSDKKSNGVKSVKRETVMERSFPNIWKLFEEPVIPAKRTVTTNVVAEDKTVAASPSPPLNTKPNSKKAARPSGKVALGCPNFMTKVTDKAIKIARREIQKREARGPPFRLCNKAMTRANLVSTRYAGAGPAAARPKPVFQPQQRK